MGKLTRRQIADESGEEELKNVKSLTLKDKDIDDATILAACTSLERLDLSNNRLKNLQGILGCSSLKWLSVASNSLESLKGIGQLHELVVLNASGNQLKEIEDEVTSLTNVKALILNNNEIIDFGGVHRMRSLNTLVLSHNSISNVGRSLGHLSALKKLSLSHNDLDNLGSALATCTALQELRLAHNRMSSLPNDLHRNSRLRILDIGSNKISTFSEVKVLSELRCLRNLGMAGNPLALATDYKKKVLSLVPRLRILDGKVLTGPDGDGEAPALSTGLCPGPRAGGAHKQQSSTIPAEEIGHLSKRGKDVKQPSIPATAFPSAETDQGQKLGKGFRRQGMSKIAYVEEESNIEKASLGNIGTRLKGHEGGEVVSTFAAKERKKQKRDRLLVEEEDIPFLHYVAQKAKVMPQEEGTHEHFPLAHGGHRSHDAVKKKLPSRRREESSGVVAVLPGTGGGGDSRAQKKQSHQKSVKHGQKDGDKSLGKRQMTLALQSTTSIEEIGCGGPSSWVD